tara:strand:- start:8147 stop:8485 length:339 start_codon:yes stop_codon:yes gene_type:complete
MSDNLDHELFEKLTKMTKEGTLTENELVRIGEWKTANYRVDYYKKGYEEIQTDLNDVLAYIEQKCNEWAQARRERSREQTRDGVSGIAASAEGASNKEGAQSGPAEKRARSE